MFKVPMHYLWAQFFLMLLAFILAYLGAGKSVFWAVCGLGLLPYYANIFHHGVVAGLPYGPMIYLGSTTTGLLDFLHALVSILIATGVLYFSVVGVLSGIQNT